ncbi:hypothetical protein CSUI_008871, partial [Cystoisospora suis]
LCLPHVEPRRLGMRLEGSRGPVMLLDSVLVGRLLPFERF